MTQANYTAITGSETIVIEQATGSISYAENNIVKTIGDAAFTNALTITGDGTVSYSSSDPDVATIDAKTGEVTIVGIGETTITATVADGTNYTYTTQTASYTLIVNVMEPVVNDNTEAEMTYETTFSDNSEVQTTALTNVVIDNILFTLDDQQTSGATDDGYDSNTGMLVLNSVVTEDVIDQVKSMIPGTEEYAEYFKGLTLMVPQGYGEIEISSFQQEGHALGVKIGNNAPIILSHVDVLTDIIPYAVSQATYVYIYHTLISSSDQVSQVRHRGPKTHVSTGLNGMKVHANLIENPSTEVYHQKILTADYLAEIERNHDGGIIIDDYYISELNDDVFVAMMEDGGSTIPYIDLRKTSITGLKVDRNMGAFRNVPVSTFIYMPVGNTSDAPNVVIGSVCDNLQLSDDSQASYCQLFDFKANSATYQFYLKAGECTTVYLPFVIENPESYGVFYQLGEMENGTVSMQVAEQLTPNTPYLFRAGEYDVYLFSADNVTVKKDDGQTSSSAFVGNYEKTMADASGRYYGLTINSDASRRRASDVDYTFTQLKAGEPILPFSAYLIVDNGPETFGIKWSDGGPTAISHLTGDQTSNEGWYTLSGQKLEGKPAQKGLYIHEGKIIVVK